METLSDEGLCVRVVVRGAWIERRAGNDAAVDEELGIRVHRFESWRRDAILEQEFVSWLVALHLSSLVQRL
jgi:hypothetical protein